MSVSVSVSTAKRLINVLTSTRTGGAIRPMSVAIYLHDLAGGGAERQSLIIAQELRQNGCDVTLVLHQLRGELLDQVPAGLRIVDLNSSRTLMDVPRLVRFLRKEKPDIFLSNVDLNNVAALLAKAISFSSTKVVICQHNSLSSSFALGGNWLYRYIALSYRLLSPLISRAVAVSVGVAAELNEMAGLPAERVLTINNPVVGPDFQARSEESLDHAWFHEPKRSVFVTAGRLVREKDHETMMRALVIHRRRFDSRLIVLGSGPLSDALTELADHLGLTASVEFSGFKPNCLPYIRQADAFLLSSRSEGFGNVIVEALGCGTPVISTRCKHGPVEILDDGRYGLLVEPGNPAAMAAAIDQAATLRQRFPVELLQRRAREFSYAVCSARYLSLFKTLAPHHALAS